MIAEVAVIIPARNEQSGIAAALRSVRTAAGELDRPVRIVVVCDACEDGTHALAAMACRGGTRPTW